MRPNDAMENLLRRLRYPAPPERRERTLQNIFSAMEESQGQTPAVPRVRIGTRVVSARTIRWALAAAVILIVLGGIGLWPFGNGRSSQWWLGAPAAWGQEILQSLGQIEAIVYRQRVGYAGDYGPARMSQGYEIRFNAKDCYRRDRYDNGVDLMNTQWVLADGNDLRMIEVSYEYRCYFERKNEAYGYLEDLMDHLRSYVRRLDKADRILKTQVFDGRECVGFEDRAGRGNNPPERLDRIWFDVETRLPARIERHYVNPSWDAGQTHIVIHDQFQYYAKVPVDLFTPQIPQGYVNAHPDDIRAARDRQVKGPMVYAEVPQGLKEKAVAALQAAGCGSYRQGGTTISFSENTWREDAGPESGGTTKWYIPRGSLPEGPFEADGRFVVTETMVDTANRTFRFRDFTAPPLPAHPMRYLLFLVRMTDRADRYEESVEKDGVQCYLFEISAKKYGDNPDGAIHRIWLDTRTSLPVRSESQWPRGDGSGTTRLVMDQFQWDPPLPDDHFVPEIPAGYTPADGKE